MLRMLRLGALLAVVRSLLRFRPDVERIRISGPRPMARVRSPLTVTGVGRASLDNVLTVRVRDESGAEVGSGTATVAAGVGGRGPFAGQVTFPAGTAPQRGRVEVFDPSPRDGHPVHLASVEVILV